jgi:hypothetical protein
LAAVGIDTPHKAFAIITTAVTAAGLLAWLYPAELRSKVLVGAITAIATLITLTILFFYNLRTLPRHAAPVTVGLSPFYTGSHRDQVKAEERAKEDAIAQLSAQSQRLTAEMATLDITSNEGQLKYKQLASQKATVDEKRAALDKLPKRRLGYVAEDVLRKLSRRQ